MREEFMGEHRENSTGCVRRIAGTGRAAYRSLYHGLLCISHHFLGVWQRRTKRFGGSKNTGCTTTGLEAPLDSPGSSILQTSQKIHRRTPRVRPSTTPAATTSPWATATGATRSEARAEVVPTLTLQPSKYLAIPLPTKFIFGIQYHVEAERAINIYVVDDTGLLVFQQGGSFHRYDSVEGVLQHTNYIQLRQGIYHLIIMNPGGEPIAIHYQIG